MRNPKLVPTQQKPEQGFVLGSGIKDRDAAAQQQQSYAHEEKIVRNSIDPRAQEIKDKMNEWTKAKKDEKKADPLKVLENDVRSNLNKLTPDNFDKIKIKILELARASKDNVDIIVQKIIEKAWVEPKYIETYAQLCNFMQADKSLIFSEAQSSAMTSTSESSKKNKNNAFKSKLLEKIQKAFETEEVTDSKAKGLKKTCEFFMNFNKI